ncbi:MAG: DUF2147 domain-containing protein [Chitinophagaceae bacterium]
MKLKLTSVFISLSFFCYAQSNADRILGKWMTTQKNLMVDVYKVNDEYKAKIIWFKDTDDKSRPMNERLDIKNPDKSLRSRKWIGIQVLNGLRYVSTENKWEDGKIYDPNTGKTWDAEASFTNNNMLKVRGYWVFKFLSKSLIFYKES